MPWLPESNAVRTASSMPNSRNAATIDTRVSTVRVLRRNSAAQIRCRYFMTASSRRGRFDERALVQMQRMAGVFRRLGIVGNHHDGLAVITIELLQQA